MKYRYVIYCVGEYCDESDYIYDTYEDAEDAATEWLSNATYGGEIMQLMGNQDEIYDRDDYDYTIEELDE